MPDVLHTVRIITYLNPEPVIADAALRIGSGRGPADNMAQGGIVVHIDLATGRCEYGSMLVDGRPQQVSKHPVTGQPIAGVVLPDWDKVCDLAKAAARTFHMLKSLGWDVGLTTKGPVLIEANWCYDIGVNQIASRKGILSTSWVNALNKEGAYKQLGLGFVNRPR